MLHHLCLSSSCLDLFLGACREGCGFHRQFLIELTAAKDLDAVEIFLNDASLEKSLGVNRGAIFKAGKSRYIDLCVMGLEIVLESALRKLSDK